MVDFSFILMNFCVSFVAVCTGIAAMIFAIGFFLKNYIRWRLYVVGEWKEWRSYMDKCIISQSDRIHALEKILKP